MRSLTNKKAWDKIYKNNKWGKYPPLSVIKFIAKHFYKANDRKTIKILEIGSGPGANLWFMAREGFTVYGIDVSPTACQMALARLTEERLLNRVGSVLTGDYKEKLKVFEDSYFDAIIDIESLYCNSFQESKKIVELCFKKLKHNGLMLSQTFNKKTWGFQGQTIEYHAMFPRIGPLAKKGYARFTTKNDIKKIYKLKKINTIRNVELQELHFNNGKSISEWIIEIEKH